MSSRFKPGISTLLEHHPEWLRGRRLGLVTHPAAVDRTGTASAELLRHPTNTRLISLFGPEHGFFGAAGAGDAVATRRHPVWNLPIHSLYGDHRRPTAAMLRGVDTLVFDMQDLATRCYTYLSTLRHILEEACHHGLDVIVADRPVPLPATIDGPVLDPAFESFVGAAAVPLSYGMTPGESALWLKTTLGLTSLNLKIAPMKGYGRSPFRGQDWPPWIPPSPGIRSWESAWCYPATVCFEALPAVDYGRGTGLPFQILGAPWMRGEAVCERLQDSHLAGVVFHPHPYMSAASNTLVGGIRITVTNPRRFLPVTCGIAILHTLQSLYGRRRLWQAPGSRPGFFDKLLGTDSVRKALLDGSSPATIAAAAQASRRRFAGTRRAALLYPTQ